MRKYRYVRPFISRAAASLGLAAALLLAACAHRPSWKPASWHLPWRHTAAAAPEAVQELTVQSEVTQAGSVTQSWYRNTLRIDLSRLSGSGTLNLLPNAVNGWPARLEFAVRAGSFSQLEVQGDQRAVFMVAPGDGAPRALPLSPSVYSASTQLLTVSWK
jgi:hypothetical protein